MLKRLGPPPFWCSSEDLVELLRCLYAWVRARAVEVPFGAEERE